MNLRIDSEGHGVMVSLTLAELAELQRAIGVRERELAVILQQNRAAPHSPQYTPETRRAAAVARVLLRSAKEKLRAAEQAALQARREWETESVKPVSPSRPPA